MVWWYWMMLGLALLGAEMTTPGGFYILFFGLSALLVGTLAGLEVVSMDWLQWLLFSVIAIGSLLVFRGPLLARMSDGRRNSTRTWTRWSAKWRFLWRPCQPARREERNCVARTWTAKNVGPTDFRKGQRGKVTKVDGLTLWITTE